MINPNASHEEVLAEEGRLVAQYELTCVDMKTGPAAFAAFDAAQVELAEFRTFWRSIGHVVDRGNDHFREMYIAPGIRNNDGSTPS